MSLNHELMSLNYESVSLIYELMSLNYELMSLNYALMSLNHESMNLNYSLMRTLVLQLALQRVRCAPVGKVRALEALGMGGGDYPQPLEFTAPPL